MTNETEISYKYEHLFDLLNKDLYPDVDTVIMTGGRASGKSYVVAILSLIGLVEYNWNVLYTRYTNMSIVDSVKPEVSDKIELLNFENRCIDTQKQIECNGNRIAFKGIKTGSKIQTANLKSLSNFNCFIVDEAEEIPNLETFKKVFYSIRSVEKRNLTILILNPTTKEHWIFKEFFEKKELEGGENTVIDNVMYIHTSYLDVNSKFIPKNILRDYERLKIESTLKYFNIVQGGWIQDPEGVLLPKSKLNFQNLSHIDLAHVIFKVAFIDPADTGGDKYSIPFIWVFQYEKILIFYVKDVIHNTNGIEANTPRTIEKSKEQFIEQIIVESNGIGLSSALLLKRDLSKNVRLSPINTSVNKEIKILSHYEFVEKHFVFDIDYENKPEYKSFINDLTSYIKGGDNKHKADAMDVLCSAVSFLKLKYNSILFG